MIPPEEFEEIADLPDDLAFLKLEEKFRRALYQRHNPREQDGEDFTAISDYINHTCEAAAELEIQGSETWVFDLNNRSPRDHYYEHLDDLMRMIDRFRVRTQIAYVRKARIASGDPDTTVSFTGGRIPPSTRGRIAPTGGSFIETENGDILTLENGDRLIVDDGEAFSGNAFAENAFATDGPALAGNGTLPSVSEAHKQMLLKARVVEATLELRSDHPGIGHNRSPEQIDGLEDLSDEDENEIKDLIAALKEQPERPIVLPEALIADVQAAGKVADKIKTLGNAYITKLVESAGTEHGKLLSIKGAVLISLAFNLRELIDAAVTWFKIVGG